jgi:RNA polymerase sigma factor (sigma-70 family)
MKPETIMMMCEGLARRYKNPNHYDDLVGEGVLQCYEILAEDPKPHPAKLYREANRRMHDYLNLDVFPVAIPASDVSRRLSRDIDADEFGDTNWSEDGINYLRNILSSEIIPFDTASLFNETVEENYEETDFYNKLNTQIELQLGEDERLLLHMKFVENMTQVDMGDFFGISQPAIVLRETKIFSKLRSIVTKLQQVI